MLATMLMLASENSDDDGTWLIVFVIFLFFIVLPMNSRK